MQFRILRWREDPTEPADDEGPYRGKRETGDSAGPPVRRTHPFVDALRQRMGTLEARNVGGLQKLEKARKRPPESFLEKFSPKDTLILSWSPVGTSDLQNCEIIQLCCLKTLNLWSL